MPAPFDQNFIQGMNMALNAAGIQDQRQRMGLQAQFQQAQMQHMQMQNQMIERQAKSAATMEPIRMAKEMLEIDQLRQPKLSPIGAGGLYNPQNQQVIPPAVKPESEKPIVVGKSLVSPTGQPLYTEPQSTTKMVEKTVDLGNRVEYIYTDGSREIKPKGKLPAEPSQLDDFFKKQLVTKTLTEIPGLKKDATTQAGNVERIDIALDLVKKGVTGKGGQFKAFLAPYAEWAGVSTEALSDAQKFQLLTRAIVGPMRLDIVGPGPVSEWEQKLMQQISGGGGAAKEAANELLTFWRKKAEDKIANYNTTLEGVATIAPEIKTVHKPINFKTTNQPMNKPTIVRSGTVKSGPNKGKRVIEYSDGSRKYE